MNIYIVDMAVPMEINVEKKATSKIEKYQQLSYEMRIKRPGYKIFIIPLIIGCCGGGAEKTIFELKKFFDEKTAEETLQEMIRTVVFYSETIIRKVMSGLIHP